MGISQWASSMPRGSYLPWPEVVPAFEVVKLQGYRGTGLSLGSMLNLAKGDQPPKPPGPPSCPLLILAMLSYSYPNTICSFRLF